MTNILDVFIKVSSLLCFIAMFYYANNSFKIMKMINENWGKLKKENKVILGSEFDKINIPPFSFLFSELNQRYWVTIEIKALIQSKEVNDKRLMTTLLVLFLHAILIAILN